VDDWPSRRLAVLTLNPGQGWRGRHLHRHKREGFYVFRGRAKAELVCARSGERLDLILEPGARLELPPGVAHRFAAIDQELVFVEYTDRSYQADDDAPFAF
jgi:L-fuculose-phosphate aldolase